MKYKFYNNLSGINIILWGNPTLKNLVDTMDIKLQDVGMILINGQIIKNYDIIIKNGDVINVFSHLLQGG